MIIHSPAAYGLILGRFLVKNNSTDLVHVQQLIDACKLSEGEARPSNRVAPFSFALFTNLSTSNLAHSVLELTARTEKAVPPFNIPHPGLVVKELAVASIYGSSCHNPISVNLTSAGNEGITTVENYSRSAFKNLNNR